MNFLFLIQQKIAGLDFFIMSWISNLWTLGIIKTFTFVSLLAYWKVIIIFLIITSVLFLLYKKQNYIFPLLVSIGGAELTVYLAKIIFHRARPSVILVIENSFSFPSGHAAISVAFYGFIAYVLIKHSKNFCRKFVVSVAGLSLVGLIGFSRLYLGAHYLSDVVAGYFVGALWLSIAIYVNLAKIFKRLQSC